MRADREMYARFLLLMIISTLIVAVIYSSISSDLYALKVRSVKLCEKSTSDGITTETCCSLETDSSTEKTTQYCTECKTTSRGEDLGCTHSQTDVGLTLDGGELGIKPIGPKVSTDKLSDDNKVQVPKGFDLKNELKNEDGVTIGDKGGKDNDSVAKKDLENQDKLGNFEIQDLMSDYKNDTFALSGQRLKYYG
ncbi:MAG: hypothetical protein QN835_10790 [Nitrososphaeraceae archaeon]|nr:hypothetical protein [Nitrososphaeraceae archaeon]MDW0267741.1 hypothetical protein [Nitrososphaeraceae archaeon]